MTFQPYTIFEHNNYVETVTNEKNGVRIVDCSELGINKLYRIEYDTNFSSHTVRYTLQDALQVFTSRLTEKFSVNYRQYTIIYRSFDSDIIVGSETIESDYKPVIHARHEIQILANQRQENMRYTIFDYTGKSVFNSTAIFQPNNVE